MRINNSLLSLFKISLRTCLLIIFLLCIWECLIIVLKTPPYILPTPKNVFITLWQQRQLLYYQTLPTLLEMTIGFSLGTLFGMFSALVLAYSKPARLWFLPLLLISQSLPTFAIAPILVVWFGYGIATKIITTIIMIFFPITNAFYDGLKNTNPAWVDLGRITHASTFNFFWHIKIPAALPSLATGLRVAAAIAPIGAIVGEWVGSDRGLGFLMLNANARMQVSLMFAALLIIMLITISFYFCIDKLLRFLLPWEKWGR